MSTYGGWPSPPTAPGWNYRPQAPQPGVIPLQPLQVGDIIGGVFRTLRRYFWPVYGPILLTALAFYALFAVALAFSYAPLHTVYNDLQAQDKLTADQVGELVTVLGLLSVLLMVGIFASYLVTTVISTAVLRHAVIGRPVTLKQIVREALPHVWRTIGTGLLLVLGAIGVLLVPVILLVVLAVAGGAGGAVFGVLLVLVGYGVILYAMIRLTLVIPVVILENQRPVESIRRAWRLNQNHWWRTLGITLLVSLIGSIASEFINYPISMITDGSLANTLVPQAGTTWSVASNLPSFSSLWLYALGLGVSSLLSLLLMPLSSLTNGLLYIDRRIRRESLDEQLAAEAGITLVTPPPAGAWGGGWGQQPYGQHPYGQPPYGGQAPYGQPYGGWPGQQPPAPGQPPYAAPQAPTVPPQHAPVDEPAKAAQATQATQPDDNVTPEDGKPAAEPPE